MTVSSPTCVFIKGKTSRSLNFVLALLYPRTDINILAYWLI